MSIPSIAAPASDWCQRWTDRRHSFRHRHDGGFDSGRYDVSALGESAAKAFVEQNHYSQTYPAARLRFALWQGVELVGVAVLSVPVQKSVLTAGFPDLEPYVESLELGRFVLIDRVPGNGESWFLARVFELAGQVGIRGVLSFSDPFPRKATDGAVVFPGHVGTIYQASNATYAGRGTARFLLLLPDGRVLNDRALAKVRSGERGHAYVEDLLIRLGASPRRREEPRSWLPGALAAAGVRRVWHPGNHRYLFRVGDRRARAAVRLGMAGLDYPKQGEAA